MLTETFLKGATANFGQLALALVDLWSIGEPLLVRSGPEFDRGPPFPTIMDADKDQVLMVIRNAPVSTSMIGKREFTQHCSDNYMLLCVSHPGLRGSQPPDKTLSTVPFHYPIGLIHMLGMGRKRMGKR